MLIDGEAANVRSSGPGRSSTLMWCTGATPADIAIGESIEDCGDRALGTPPPPNGTRFTINEIAPGTSGTFHRTETLDYVLVISGVIDMELDEGCVSLAAGDVLIQRGTAHRWINRGTIPARIAFILIDAVALGIRGDVLRTA